MAITMSVEEYKQLFGTPEPEDSVEKQIARKQASSQKRSVQSGINNSLGQKFETLISYACDEYKRQGVAYIKKTPEPFRVLCKKGKGQFIGQFGNGQNAQPDYTGTLKGGRSIMFEAKATSTDIIRRGVLSETQMEMLETHHQLGAECFVLISIQERYYKIPWVEWRDMKEYFGKVSLRQTDVKDYEIIQEGKVVLPFL